MLQKLLILLIHQIKIKIKISLILLINRKI